MRERVPSPPHIKRLEDLTGMSGEDFDDFAHWTNEQAFSPDDDLVKAAERFKSLREPDAAPKGRAQIALEDFTTAARLEQCGRVHPQLGELDGPLDVRDEPDAVLNRAVEKAAQATGAAPGTTDHDYDGKNVLAAKKRRRETAERRKGNP